MARTIRKARTDPAAFVRYLLMDPLGPRDPLPEIHRDLQNHLSAHRLALVELPRDHGKTTQVCLRVLWELGRAPNLRIKIVCASESIAVDRSRFLRHSIERNPSWAMIVLCQGNSESFHPVRSPLFPTKREHPAGGGGVSWGW